MNLTVIKPANKAETVPARTNMKTKTLFGIMAALATGVATASAGLSLADPEVWVIMVAVAIVANL